MANEALYVQWYVQFKIFLVFYNVGLNSYFLIVLVEYIFEATFVCLTRVYESLLACLSL